MDELLQNPAVQAGVAPFIVALAVAGALSRTRLLALAQVAGFLTMAGLAIGFSFESLTSVKKLVLVGLATGVASMALEWKDGPPRAAWGATVALVGAGCIWMLWRLLAQQEAGSAWLIGALAAGYTCALVGSVLYVGADPVRGSAAGLMVGLGTGALAVLGASAVLGFAGIAVGAAAGATLLVQMLRGRAARPGVSISLPSATVAALAGVLAAISASLPWYCLLPVLAAPFATLLVPQALQPVWLRAFVTSLAALVPMLVAVALAWFAGAAA